MNAQLDAAIARLKESGEALAQARSEEQRLEDERPLLKELAIIRIMARDGSAATRAEKIVESDSEYMAHRIAQRGSVVARFKADAEYWAAKCEATQASLITQDVLTLEAENVKFSRMIDDLDRESTELRKKLVATMRARDDANNANADLVRANRELAGELVTASETINLLNESLRVAGVA